MNEIPPGIPSAALTGREVTKMCQPRSGHSHAGMRRCTCGCCGCGGGHMARRFYTAKEEEEWLEDYRDQLKKELAGLEERLKERKQK